MHSVQVELPCLTVSPMTEIVKDTALQSQASSLAPQNQFEVPMSPWRTIEMEQNSSTQRSPMGPEHRLACLQSYATQLTSMPHHLRRGIIHQQNSETVVGTVSRFWAHPMGSHTVRGDAYPNAPDFPPARQFRSVDKYCILRQIHFLNPTDPHRRTILLRVNPPTQGMMSAMKVHIRKLLRHLGFDQE